MARIHTDRSLLFGLLALQNGLIDQAKLVAAFQAWTLDKGRSLAAHLVSRGDLDTDDRSAVEALVARHLKKHGDSTEKSLAAIPAVPSLQRSLLRIADPDIGASLAVLGPETDRDASLARLFERTGAFTDITLAEADPDLEPALKTSGQDVLDGCAGRYQILGEIARGGMGSVLRARDPHLGRDLALKVLLDHHRDRSDLVGRFVEEAQICGQLQHPGVVPVHELGTLADHRPFFAMKLVKGQTLTALLAERSCPANDLPRFLTIFEAICQTMAYAHARGVIHRDLKPSNVMVGSFGEVQVMDWGLAKVLPREGQPSREHATPPVNATVVATVRTKGDSDLSQAGSVLGTPAYMAPEQARGETEAIDRRADIFALGSILCEILTGAPAFSGGSSIEVLRAAGRADTASAMVRLEQCGADLELLALARDCLAALAKDRPADAGVVAARLTAYLAGVQERLREAELSRAAESARAVEALAKAAAERRARRLTGALAATVLFAGVLGGAGWRWVELQRLQRVRETSGRINEALRDATRLRGLAQGAAVDEPGPWAVAASAADKARDLLEPGIEPGLRKQVEDLATGLAAERGQAEAAAQAARRDRTVLDRLVDIRSAEADDWDGRSTDAAYADAFRDAGLDVAALSVEEAAGRIRGRPPATATALASAVDDWAAIRRDRRKDRAGAASLVALARAADPDDWRNRLRTALDQPDAAARLTALQGLAGGASYETLGPVSLDLLGRALNNAADPAGAETVLQRAQQRHASDVWINYDLAVALEKLARREEAIRYYTAARSLRPETAHELGHALEKKGDADESIAVFRDLQRLRPRNARHLGCLGKALKARGRSQEAALVLEAAVASASEAIRARPHDAYAHSSLAFSLETQGKLVSAIAEYRTVLRLLPDSASTHDNLGVALKRQGKLNEAIAEHRTAIRLQPDLALAHTNLGSALDRQGNQEEAIAEYRTAIRLQPDFALAHNGLGFVLDRQGKGEEAIAEYRTVVRLLPDDAYAHNILAWALATHPNPNRREPAEVLEHARKAVALAPNDGNFHNTLALAEYRIGNWAESIAAAERSIALAKGADASDWFFLAMAHFQRGVKDPSRSYFDRAVAWTTKNNPKNAELLAFWREAAELLGQPGPIAAAPLPDLPAEPFAP
jgi:eukaryotic-like serine/threonine-protein kinase